VLVAWNFGERSRHSVHRVADIGSPLRTPVRFSATERGGLVVALAPLLSLIRMPIFKMVAVCIPGGLVRQTLLTVRQP